jgi:hypothetical protein
MGGQKHLGGGGKACHDRFLGQGITENKEIINSLKYRPAGVYRKMSKAWGREVGGIF